MTINMCSLWGSYYRLYLCDVMSDTYEWVYTDSRILSHNQHSFLLHHSHYLHISGRQLQYSLQSVLKRRRQLLYQPFYTPHLLSVGHKTIKCIQGRLIILWYMRMKMQLRRKNNDSLVSWTTDRIHSHADNFPYHIFKIFSHSHQNLSLGSNVPSSHKIQCYIY